MAAALIGHTGFVGGNLRQAHGFEALFNSSNMDGSRGQNFDLGVCAAAPASMWAANRDPEGDAQLIGTLIGQLQGLRAQSFVLISTIAVLGDVAGGHDENTTVFEETLAYGRNRRTLERACQEHFDDCIILRLPALFGRGLKKNFVFDVLNPLPSFLTAERFEAARKQASPAEAGALERLFSADPASGTYLCERNRSRTADGEAAIALLERLHFTAPYFTHCGSTFQYYDLGRLWDDIGRARAAGLDVVHLAPEPASALEIHEAVTSRPFSAEQAVLRHEDMRTKHAKVFGGEGDYITSKADVLSRLTEFSASGQDR